MSKVKRILAYVLAFSVVFTSVISGKSMASAEGLGAENYSYNGMAFEPGSEVTFIFAPFVEYEDGGYDYPWYDEGRDEGFGEEIEVSWVIPDNIATSDMVEMTLDELGVEFPVVDSIEGQTPSSWRIPCYSYDEEPVFTGYFYMNGNTKFKELVDNQLVHYAEDDYNHWVQSAYATYGSVQEPLHLIAFRYSNDGNRNVVYKWYKDSDTISVNDVEDRFVAPNWDGEFSGWKAYAYWDDEPYEAGDTLSDYYDAVEAFKDQACLEFWMEPIFIEDTSLNTPQIELSSNGVVYISDTVGASKGCYYEYRVFDSSTGDCVGGGSADTGWRTALQNAYLNGKDAVIVPWENSDLTSGTYYVELRASLWDMVNQKKLYSEYVKTNDFTITAASQKLAAPSNLTVDKQYGVYKWDNVAGASEYNITVEMENDNGEWREVSGSIVAPYENKGALSQLISCVRDLGAGKYRVSVKAITSNISDKNNSEATVVELVYTQDDIDAFIDFWNLHFNYDMIETYDDWWNMEENQEPSLPTPVSITMVPNSNYHFEIIKCNSDVENYADQDMKYTVDWILYKKGDGGEDEWIWSECYSNPLYMGPDVLLPEATDLSRTHMIDVSPYIVDSGTYYIEARTFKYGYYNDDNDYKYAQFSDYIRSAEFTYTRPSNSMPQMSAILTDDFDVIYNTLYNTNYAPYVLGYDVKVEFSNRESFTWEEEYDFMSSSGYDAYSNWHFMNQPTVSHFANGYRWFSEFASQMGIGYYRAKVFAASNDIRTVANYDYKSDPNWSNVVDSDKNKMYTNLTTIDSDAAKNALTSTVNREDLRTDVMTNSSARENVSIVDDNYAEKHNVSYKTASVDNTAENVYGVAPDKVEMKGAALNAPDNSEVSLGIQTKTLADLDLQSYTVPDNAAVFDLKLECTTNGVTSELGTGGDLDIPIIITMPLPTTLEVNKPIVILHELHYPNDNGDMFEKIYPQIDWQNKLITFSVLHFSNFVFTNEEDTGFYHNVNFNTLGGNSIDSILVGEGYEFGTLPTPDKGGVEFLGWFTEANGGTRVDKTTVMGNSDITIYAHWNQPSAPSAPVAATPAKHILSFVLNGGTSSVTTKELEKGALYGELPIPVRKGYDFLGWYTADMGGQLVSAETTMGDTDVTIYAHWKKQVVKQFKLTYNVNGGDKLATTSKNLGAGYTYGKLPTPKRSGYIFVGWFTKKSGGSKVTSATKMKNANVTIYARWKRITAPKKVSAVVLKSGKKSFEVSFKKAAGADGYEIAYSTKRNMKSAVVKTVTENKVTINDLKNLKAYYVKIRAYKLDSKGKKVYGNWSKVMPVVTK